MSALTTYRPRLQSLLDEITDAHGVPGTVCGVLLDDEMAVVAHGVANVATGVETTPDTLFQIGSITKLYTTTLVLQAHSAGILALDEPVRAQLQEFSVSDPAATLEITPRQLLTHTSGIAGDHLHDTGANSDALQRYVATLAALGQVHAPDEAYSFCNTGFGVAGRLLEVAVGGNFDQILRRRLTRPLGCDETLTLPQHLLLRRTAVGHVQVAGGPATRQPRWTLRRSNGPMGGIVCTAEDLLAFARMHMSSGRAAAGSDVLPPAAVKLMAEPHTDTPLPGESQALGWTLRRWGDSVCLSQDADTFGQRAFLRVVPSAGFALCLLTNSPLGAAVAQQLIPRVVGDLIEVDARPPHVVRAAEQDEEPPTFDPRPFVGTYGRLHQRIVVEQTGEPGEPSGLAVTVEPSGVLEALGATRATMAARPLDPAHGMFMVTDPATGVDTIVVFGEPGEMAPSVLYEGRLHPRVFPRAHVRV